MKINKIKVNGYKNLIDCELSLTDFNVLIGANNSGKSNVLEIFSFLDALITGSDKVKSELFAGYLPENKFIRTRCDVPEPNRISIEIEFTEDFDVDVYNYWYSMAMYIDDEASRVAKTGLTSVSVASIQCEQFKYKNKSATGKPITVFEREDEFVYKLKGIKKVNKIEPLVSIIAKIPDIKESLEFHAQKGLDLLYSICKTPVIYSNSDEIKKSLNSKEAVIKIENRLVALPLAEEIAKIKESHDGDLFMDILKDVLEIEDIEIFRVGSYKLLYIKFYNKFSIPLQDLSDGTLIVLNLITYLISNEYPIITLEELENSIHPKLLRKLINLIKYHFSDTQIIITTHSPVLLNMVELEEINIITNEEYGAAKIIRVQDKKDLVKKLSGPFADIQDIFEYEIEE